MAEAKDYIWLFPFIGAILTAISLFTPAVFKSYPMGGSQFIWMDGFAVFTGGPSGPETDFIDIAGYYIPGIIATIFLTVCTIILFVSSLTHRQKETPGSWIALGILLIGGAIYFIVGVEIGVAIHWFNEFETYGYTPEWISFWNDYDYNPGFAVIAPFIGGGLALLGAIIGKSIGKQEGIGKPKAAPKVEKPVPVAERPAPTPTPVTEEAKVVRFCPECGTKIEQADSTFCSACGHKF
ncbi:MAG: zinc ribbon domain-containing protein [Promethearchaeota archaeon]